MPKDVCSEIFVASDLNEGDHGKIGHSDKSRVTENQIYVPYNSQFCMFVIVGQRLRQLWWISACDDGSSDVNGEIWSLLAYPVHTAVCLFCVLCLLDYHQDPVAASCECTTP